MDPVLYKTQRLPQEQNAAANMEVFKLIFLPKCVLSHSTPVSLGVSGKNW